MRLIFVVVYQIISRHCPRQTIQLFKLKHNKHQDPPWCLTKVKIFEIPINDGLLVIYQDSTDIEHEAVKPSQKELIQDLIVIVNQIDTDKVFVDDALRSKLQQVQHQLETLSDLAKPRTSRTKYL